MSTIGEIKPDPSQRYRVIKRMKTGARVDMGVGFADQVHALVWAGEIAESIVRARVAAWTKGTPEPSLYVDVRAICAGATTWEIDLLVRHAINTSATATHALT